MHVYVYNQDKDLGKIIEVNIRPMEVRTGLPLCCCKAQMILHIRMGLVV